MRKNIILTLAVGTAILTGCAIHHHYERPDVNTTGLIRDNVSLTDTLTAQYDDGNFGNLPWKSVFTDPLLQTHIQTELHKNADLLNAALNVKMSEAQLKAAKLVFLPQFTFSPQGTIASWDGNAATKTYQLPFAASWSTDLYGNLFNLKKAAQVQLMATKDYQTLVQTSIVSSVANMYYTLLMLDKQMAVLDDMTKLTKETWDMMKLQMDLGRARSTSVQSAEANYYSVQTQAVDMKRQIREVENSLSLVMGQPAQQIARGKLEDQHLPTEFSTGVGIQLLANRADVHYAEMKLAQCFYDVENARSKFYPNLTITPSATFTNNAGGIVNPGKWLLSAVGSLTAPIFMKGQLTLGLKVAQAQYEQAYNSWQNAVLKAGSEVSNALVAYNSSDEKGRLEAKRMATLEKNVEHTRMLFKNSGSSYLEVITAQQTLLNSQLSKITDDFNKMQAVVNLYSALGGGGK